MTGAGAILVGDGIENPGNALAMLHAAQMYGVGCSFRDTKGLRESETLRVALNGRFPATTENEIQASHSRIIAFDNLPGAADVYGFDPGKDLAVLVGNERRGLSHRFRDLSTDAVQIPMLSRRINCLNVAAASAVALHYLCHVRVGPMAKRRNPASRRPELLLVGAEDHIELGSAIRSAAAFGWGRAFIEDREQVWFGCDRIKRSEGRATARRSRNVIRLVPCSAGARHSFSEVTVITTSRVGVPLHRARLARGPGQLVVIPDETRVHLAEEPWGRLGQDVQFAHLDTAVDDFTYHYRLVATVALAEVSRQVGRRPPEFPRPRRRPPVYDRVLELASETVGEDVWLEELLDY
ncbi:MAG: TrmH family RNA methyltransferase [Nitrospinota bacterium]